VFLIPQLRAFVSRWSFFCSLVIRDLTLRSAQSFGSFHLLRLVCLPIRKKKGGKSVTAPAYPAVLFFTCAQFFDEYLMYLTEKVATDNASVLQRVPAGSVRTVPLVLQQL
jgi:hypothetical protein